MLLLFKLNTLYQFKGQYHILIIMSFLSNIVLDRYDEQFDFLYYINRYPDLKQNNINTYNKAFHHWLTHGKKEGRICNIRFDHLYKIKPYNDVLKKYFDWKYYINKYNINNINTEHDALSHWMENGVNSFKICNSLFEPDLNLEMNNILFCINHHQTSPIHIDILENCIKSIRVYYPNNDILVIKTSTSKIPDRLLDYNIIIENKLDDDSFFVGCYPIISKMPHKNFILIHDSMYLINKISSEILYKKIYSLWYFNCCFDFPKEKYISFRDNCNLNDLQKIELDKLYANFSLDWLGCLGSCIGGQTKYLNDIIYTININNQENKLNGSDNAMLSERFIPIICNLLNIHDTFTTSPALNGNAFPFGFIKCTTIDLNEVKELAKQNDFNGYFWKLKINRVN
jgi:hypothetical protein